MANSLRADELVSAKVREELGTGVIPFACALVVEYLDDNGEHQLATFHDDEQTFYAREGMIRVLLRDAMAMPVEYERRRARRQADAEGE